MSQISFEQTLNDGRTVQVIGGWDPPLHYYHFTIYDVSSSQDEENILYSCLDDADVFSISSNDKYKDVLNKLSIIAPDGFWEWCDKKLGNEIFHHKNGGWVKVY